jgi:hypothetical protein
VRIIASAFFLDGGVPKAADRRTQTLDGFVPNPERFRSAEALAKVQRNWLVKLRTEKGLSQAVNLAGPFIMTSQGKP